MSVRSIGVLAFAMVLMSAVAGWSEREREIPLSKVPRIVIEAAEKQVPGIKLTEAEVEQRSDGEVYELEGSADGKQYEINISAEGVVLRTSAENDDDD